MADEKENEEEVLELDEEAAQEAGVLEKLKKLRAELKACQKEKAEYLAGWQRAKADFINARKDEEKSREEFLKFAEARVLKDFLAVADSLELALKLKPSEGMGQIYSQLLEILREHGAQPMEVLGKIFDPSEEEALEKVEVGEPEKDGVVLEVLAKGWRLRERVLRPAKVKVGVLRKNEPEAR